MNTFLNGLRDADNYALTENGATTHKTTKSDILDMFALCGAFRNRSEDDCITMFKNALLENESLAIKCLFYLADCRGGQGERRFFRVCFKWLANNYPTLAARNIEAIPEYRRWDDVLYSCVGTPVEEQALAFIKRQLALDCDCNTPSLLAKWLPSENASSEQTKKMGTIVRKYLKLTHKQYRMMLSELRTRINIVEKLMSENRWDEIEFDKIPSRAGLIYKNAFARRDIIAQKYEAFAKDKNTTVNAEVLNPVDIAHKAFHCNHNDNTDRAMLDKYWANLKDYYNGRQENGIAIVDTSGSMMGVPIEAATSMGAYIAERSPETSPFHNYFITFSDNPHLVRFEGVDIVDKLNRVRNRSDWEMSTNIEAVFNMLLDVAQREGTKPEDMPERLYIFSDMEFNACMSYGKVFKSRFFSRSEVVLGNNDAVETLLETIAKRWAAAGYELPKVVFWNLDSRQNNIPALGGRFSYVSGFSISMVEAILSGKDGYDLCLEKLLSERYAPIH